MSILQANPFPTRLAGYLQALQVVARSDLIAVLPEGLIRAYAFRLKVTAMPVPLDVGRLDEYLLHSAHTHTDAGCVWLRGVLKDIVQNWIRSREPGCGGRKG